MAAVQILVQLEVLLPKRGGVQRVAVSPMPGFMHLPELTAILLMLDCALQPAATLALRFRADSMVVAVVCPFTIDSAMDGPAGISILLLGQSFIGGLMLRAPALVGFIFGFVVR